MYERIILITRETRLQELTRRFNTVGQAKFYIEHSGADFACYEREDRLYQEAVQAVLRSLNLVLPIQVMDRSFLPNFLFTDRDIVIAIGQDGIVANTAKYIGQKPLIGINPDPATIDGILVTTRAEKAGGLVKKLFAGNAYIKKVTMAEATFSDGQHMLAFNDLFIGARSHVSARYRLEYDGQSEEQSSSGIIVSTGAGSTGWLSSAFNMASALCRWQGQKLMLPNRMDWSAPELFFVVREPFISRHSAATVCTGKIDQDNELVIESHIPQGGTIFSDGIEDDFITFNSGTTATIRTAAHQASLVLS